jgi:predicted outer membrane repeat protein
LSLDSSTVSGNSAAYLGGGIYSSGTLTLTNCTFFGNTPDNLFGDFLDGGGNTFG